MKIEKMLMTVIAAMLIALTILACAALLMYKNFSDNQVMKVGTRIVIMGCENSTGGSLRCRSKQDSMVCYKDPDSKLYCLVPE